MSAMTITVQRPVRTITITGAFPAAAMQAQLNDILAVLDVAVLKSQHRKLSADNVGDPIVKNT